MPVVAGRLIYAPEQHGLSPLFREADHAGVRDQEIGEGVCIAGSDAVVIIIVGVVVPLGEQADGEDPAKTLQIVEVHSLRRARGIERHDLTHLRLYPAVQIAAEELPVEEGLGRRDRQLHPGIRAGELLGEHHAQQELHIGRPGEDGALPGVLLQAHQQSALFEGRRGEVQLRQVGEEAAHHLSGAAEPLLLELGVIVGPKALSLPRRQPQVVDHPVQRIVGQYPLPCQRLGERCPLHPGQPGERRDRHLLLLQELPQIFAEQQHTPHLILSFRSRPSIA